ncbi:hypothetical protein KIN20_017138 [Parelaphostrongylus tenuis]|uniref:SKP1 component dimerisation domain-containing protein n=1 Tax=Parelaphostrongylus tenuis TaxID=148309 RepID=A0AAD5ML37_PARTN|nr:hypothetical protein KIN20_017138 [Parelaphostrongylus tenuis]
MQQGTADCVSKTCVSTHTGIADTPGRRRVFSTADGKHLYVSDADFSNFSAIRTLFEDAGPRVEGSPDSVLTLPVCITSDVLDKLVLLARCRCAAGKFITSKVDSVLGNATVLDLLNMIEACMFLDARFLARECARRVANSLDGKTVVEMRVLLGIPVDTSLSPEMSEKVEKISRFVLSTRQEC